MTKRETLEWLIENDVVNCRNAARNRDILTARFIDGLTYEQIAEEFDIAPITVSRTIHKHGDPILIKLSKMMQE